MPFLTIEVIHRFILPDLATPAIMGAINQTRSEIMAAIDELQREVRENQDATQSAITLLGNLKTKLDEAIASGDMSKVQELSDTLSANTDALAAAVAANTPADPNVGGGTTEG